jgi:predicted CoA-binding protein
MSELRQKVDDFLAQDCIAVAGVSRSGGEAANLIYRKLKASGHRVFPINPRAGEVEGARCYASLKDVPEAVGGVVVCTPPAEAEALVRQCTELGVRRVWMHRAFGAGSVSPRAVELARAEGLSVIAGGCPMMFVEPVDVGHKCIRFVLRWTGGLPH